MCFSLTFTTTTTPTPTTTTTITITITITTSTTITYMYTFLPTEVTMRVVTTVETSGHLATPQSEERAAVSLQRQDFYDPWGVVTAMSPLGAEHRGRTAQRHAYPGLTLAIILKVKA